MFTPASHVHPCPKNTGLILSWLNLVKISNPFPLRILNLFFFYHIYIYLYGTNHTKVQVQYRLNGRIGTVFTSVAIILKCTIFFKYNLWSEGRFELYKWPLLLKSSMLRLKHKSDLLRDYLHSTIFYLTYARISALFLNYGVHGRIFFMLENAGSYHPKVLC